MRTVLLIILALSPEVALGSAAVFVDSVSSVDRRKTAAYELFEYFHPGDRDLALRHAPYDRMPQTRASRRLRRMCRMTAMASDWAAITPVPVARLGSPT